MDDLTLYGFNGNEIDSLVQTVKVVYEDAGMSFGIEKCAALAVKRGKEDESNGIDLGEKRAIQSADDEGYKYLVVLAKEVSAKDEGEYEKRMSKACYVRPILKSKLVARNIFQGMDTRAVPAICYWASLIQWAKEELEYLNKKLRKPITMHGGLHP